ncbi:ATP-binding protein [Nitrospirillum viridazoti]|uniref:Histidine kinase n=1 Tax=Nitrospirillum viridazoti CBAmc TaxID=1441467 RepID=A0A248JZ66_9PROT|nr:ATP-binding protein [Nitrospirillum amazonense]ASG24033.1 histidine kinase [Nitrospirillum amazonense CBAmc]TWB26066.1 signal transduction histidine kinase [Nitrospirillum amazonense]
MREAAFQTRARTVDHLGRGQIADAPTAVSELWKNAYDAYASYVGLYIFDGAPEVAAVVDDGCGMSADDFTERWLVLGTESKFSDSSVPAETFGLTPRERQGEKGIGRLSAAYLAPAALVLSKKAGAPFAAVLVDWRLFENPYLNLDDIRIPVEEFAAPSDLMERLPAMIDLIRSNLGGADDERGRRLSAAWQRFDAFEQSHGSYTTKNAIAQAWAELPIGERHLNEWPVFAGLAEHGTGFFLLGVHYELAQWTRPDVQNEEIEAVRERWRQTLSGFTDPYSSNKLDFSYEVLLYTGSRSSRIASDTDVFGFDDLWALEHVVDGEFDEDGVFRGRIKAFGRDLGERTYVPKRPPPKFGRDRLGPFRFCIAAAEQDPLKTTHTANQLAIIKQQQDKHAGITFYRDGLRVMPYGRPESDVFELEERRGRHAGRYYWSHRRSFGRVAISRGQNPSLRDKAGREGLVDNRAFREMKALVSGLLIEVAFKYIGSDADLRNEILPELMARNVAARTAAEKARTKRKVGLKGFLRKQRGALDSRLTEAVELAHELEQATKLGDREKVALAAARLQDIVQERLVLKPPAAGGKLGDVEERYREYRDQYKAFVAELDRASKLLAGAQAKLGPTDPKEVLTRSFSSHQATLANRVDGYMKEADQQIEALRGIWRQRAEEDRAKYYQLSRPLLEEDIESLSLVRMLNLLDRHRMDLEEEFASTYEPLVKSLQQLAEGIDLDSALAVVDDDRQILEDKVNDLNAVAQVGITVEIIGHELETLDAEVRRNLSRLPDEIRRSTAFKLAYDAHHALTERLRFLSPLKVAGYRARETITGRQIADYLGEFFAQSISSNRITLTITDAFRGLTISDVPSRIYPVYINLVNNAVYWASQAIDRRITLDLVDGLVVVADSGPGVDVDDLHRLFELFFTKKRSGRGIGLYLARANLAVAGHQIRYAREEDPHVLPGANFIIEFKGILNVAS